MTFLENFGIIMDAQRDISNIGMALKALIQKAKEEERLVCGVYECALKLQSIPEDVALCLLPEVVDSDDVTANIQHKLVEAFCWENGIEVIKVNNIQKVWKLFSMDKCDANNTDIGCVLIQNEKTNNNETDFINNYYSMLANQTPAVSLPD